MSFFNGLEQAQASERGVPFTPAFDGLIKILGTQVFDSSTKGSLYIVKCEVMENRSADPNCQTGCPVGSQRTWFVSFRNRQQALSNVKGFLLATLGFDLAKDTHTGRITQQFDPISKALAEESADPGKQPLKNFLVRLRTTLITTKETKEPFTRHDWSPVDSKPTIAP